MGAVFNGRKLSGITVRREIMADEETHDEIVTTDKGSIDMTVIREAILRLAEEGPVVCTENGK